MPERCLENHVRKMLIICFQEVPITNSLSWICRKDMRAARGVAYLSSGSVRHDTSCMDNETSEPRESLYKRLGGYDVIAGIVAGLFQRLKEDPRFARFGMGRSLDSKARVQQLTVEQLCALAGGPCIYLGRDMKTSHGGLGITKAEWEANREHTLHVLQEHGIGEPEQGEFLELFERYRTEIVATANE
jgi:hemoglobin